MLDHAYIYGFDECTPDMFPLLEQTAQKLRQRVPGRTAHDHHLRPQLRHGHGVKTMDAWCPLTPSFDPAQAAKARAAGREVWWYICCGPHHPHANMFIEYPAIEGRLLMGAMTAKQRPDGFLYYQISIWNSRRPITSGPFTDWDPRSWTTYHGDGSWTCVGPDGTPAADDPPGELPRRPGGLRLRAHSGSDHPPARGQGAVADRRREAMAQ